MLLEQFIERLLAIVVEIVSGIVHKAVYENQIIKYTYRLRPRSQTRYPGNGRNF